MRHPGTQPEFRAHALRVQDMGRLDVLGNLSPLCRGRVRWPGHAEGLSLSLFSEACPRSRESHRQGGPAASPTASGSRTPQRLGFLPTPQDT